MSSATEDTHGDPELKVRVAAVADADSLFRVQRASALAAFAHIFPPDQFPFPEEAERERWGRYLSSPDKTVLLAERSTSCLGMVVLSHDALERLFVHPDHWSEGVGTRLHDEAVVRFRERGYDDCTLMVLEENRRARRFYENRGWKLDGRQTASAFPPYPVALGYKLTGLLAGGHGSSR